MKSINRFEWHESNDPTQTAKVVYGRDISYYNYRDLANPVVQKVMNLLAVGGTVYLVAYETAKTGYEITLKHEDRARCIQYQMIQLDYLVNKYNRVKNEYYQKLLDIKFPSINHARMYFHTGSWEAEKRELLKTKLSSLDALEEPIIELAQSQAVNIMSVQEQKRIANLYAAAKELGVLEDLKAKKVYPNQSVTAPLSPEIDFQVGYGEDGPYISSGDNLRNTRGDIMEAYLVNAWLFKNGFREESLDDQLEELVKLREWWVTYSSQARRTGVANPQARTVEKYERMVQLEGEIGHILDQVPTHLLAIMQ